MNKYEKKIDYVTTFERFGALIFVILLLLFFRILNEHFLNWSNIEVILLDFSIYGLMGIGMTYVILTAGIDLSVGSILAFAAIVAAYFMKKGDISNYTANPELWNGYSWIIGIITAISVGSLIGFVQGLAIYIFRIHPFIVTLGGLTIWRGLTLLLTNGRPIAGFDSNTEWWGQGNIFNIPIPVIIVLLAFVIGYIALHHTRWGRHLFAVGGNVNAARLQGINVSKIIISIYTTIGFLAGLTGFLLAARLGSAETIAGTNYELRVIAGVVIGGTSLLGGIGSIQGTLVGSLLIAILLSGLTSLNISPYYQQISMGLIIIIAVVFDTYAKNRRTR